MMIISIMFFVRSPKGYEEITNKNYNKDALINDLVYDVSELVKERNKKQYSILDKIRDEIIEKYWDCDICKWKTDYKPHYNVRGDINDILQIIDKYKKTEGEE